MTQSPTPLDALLVTIVLVTLAIGLPILVVLSIRFLWDRRLHLGRSKELEKLIWQLHRIASALEHQMKLSFPVVQPGTEEPHDLPYLQQLGPQPTAVSPSAPSSAAAPATHQRGVQQPEALQPIGQQASDQLPALQEPAAGAPRRGGVNSMFGL